MKPPGYEALFKPARSGSKRVTTNVTVHAMTDAETRMRR